MGRSWAPVAAPGLPDGVILFDGVCVFCSRWVAYVAARDGGRFRFTAVQSPYGGLLARRLGIDAAAPQTNAVVVGGRALFKSDAALAVLGALPCWSWVRMGAVVPRALRDWVYDRVAINRYRLFGRLEVCMTPAPELARRVLHDVPP